MKVDNVLKVSDFADRFEEFVPGVFDRLDHDIRKEVVHKMDDFVAKKAEF